MVESEGKIKKKKKINKGVKENKKKGLTFN